MSLEIRACWGAADLEVWLQNSTFYHAAELLLTNLSLKAISWHSNTTRYFCICRLLYVILSNWHYIDKEKSKKNTDSHQHTVVFYFFFTSPMQLYWKIRWQKAQIHSKINKHKQTDDRRIRESKRRRDRDRDRQGEKERWVFKTSFFFSKCPNVLLWYNGFIFLPTVVESINATLMEVTLGIVIFTKLTFSTLVSKGTREVHLIVRYKYISI